MPDFIGYTCTQQDRSSQNAPRIDLEKFDKWCAMDCHSVVGGKRQSNCQGKRLLFNESKVWKFRLIFNEFNIS